MLDCFIDPEPDFEGSTPCPQCSDILYWESSDQEYFCNTCEEIFTLNQIFLSQVDLLDQGWEGSYVV